MISPSAGATLVFKWDLHASHQLWHPGKAGDENGQLGETLLRQKSSISSKLLDMWQTTTEKLLLLCFGQSTAGASSVRKRACARAHFTHPIYCSGWLWWITILHVGHVLFSSKYLTRQLRQTANTQAHAISNTGDQQRRCVFYFYLTQSPSRSWPFTSGNLPLVIVSGSLLTSHAHLLLTCSTAVEPCVCLNSCMVTWRESLCLSSDGGFVLSSIVRGEKARQSSKLQYKRSL